MQLDDGLKTKIGAALLGLVMVLTAWYTGEIPDWEPISDLLVEFTAAGVTGVVTFPVMQWLKGKNNDTFIGKLDSLYQSYLHIALAVILAVGAYAGLVALGLTEVSQRGAAMMALATVATGKQVWQHYKKGKEDKAEKMGEEPIVNVVKQEEYADTEPSEDFVTAANLRYLAEQGVPAFVALRKKYALTNEQAFNIEAQKIPIVDAVDAILEYQRSLGLEPVGEPVEGVTTPNLTDERG